MHKGLLHASYLHNTVRSDVKLSKTSFPRMIPASHQLAVLHCFTNCSSVSALLLLVSTEHYSFHRLLVARARPCGLILSFDTALHMHALLIKPVHDATCSDQGREMTYAQTNQQTQTSKVHCNYRTGWHNVCAGWQNYNFVISIRYRPRVPQIRFVCDCLQYKDQYTTRRHSCNVIHSNIH